MHIKEKLTFEMFSAETDDQIADSSMIEDPSSSPRVTNVGLRIIELEFQDRVTLRGEGGESGAALGTLGENKTVNFWLYIIHTSILVCRFFLGKLEGSKLVN